MIDSKQAALILAAQATKRASSLDWTSRDQWFTAGQLAVVRWAAHQCSDSPSRKQDQGTILG